MDRLKDYSIPFKGLGEGHHLFEYEIGSSFFALFEQALLEEGDIKAKVELLKNDVLLTLDFSVKGQVTTICDNCLETLVLPVENKSRVYVKFGEEYDEPTEEIIVLPREAYELNVAQLLYEFICVTLPIRHVHPNDVKGHPTCDPEMLNRLDEYLVEQSDDDENEDPRWDELKKLLG